MTKRNYTPWTVGLDEVGRGPLAGPVMAAAVIMPQARSLTGLRDSKLLSASQREELYELITASALDWAVGRAEVEEIDQLNILQASLLAMRRAVEALGITPKHALVDGNQNPKLLCSVDMIVDGDQLEPLISAASIVAKVTRDREMIALDHHYPGYGFAQHKGYSTRAHLAALENLGPCLIHRKSFAPVKKFYLTTLE